jgi:hypothetical protein
MTHLGLPLNIGNLSKDLPTSFNQMVLDMKASEQMKGLSVYEHGELVKQHFESLEQSLKNESSGPEWRMPKCLLEHKAALLCNLHDKETVGLYTLYHDCGKPYCLQVDEQGKRHFPNHADASCYIWNLLSDNQLVGRLIQDDMVLHTCSSEELAAKLAIWQIQDACTLLFAAVSEIHANATMFGGIESVSFKMKFKQLERRGTQLCKHFFS